MIFNSGETNVVVPTYQDSTVYSPFDVVFFTGSSLSASQSGFYYHTGTTFTSSHSTSPSGASSLWTQDFIWEPSYGMTVSYKNSFYDVQFGDGYYSLLSKSENSLKATFTMEFNKRSDSEANGLVHFLENSFNNRIKPSGGYTGIYWTPPAPYNLEHEFFVENIENTLDYPNVNTITTSFYNESESTTDWKDFYIPFSGTRGYFETGVSYEHHDIVYASGPDYGKYTSGWYYNTGQSLATGTSNNGPVGGSTVWGKDTFYFDINNGVVFNESPRFYKQNFQNDFFVRTDDGINKSLLDLNFSLIGRSDKEAKAIVHFLEKHRGKDQFLFTPPSPYNSEKVFICPSWDHTMVFKDNNTISVKFLEQPINYLTDEVEFLSLITVDPYLPL